MKPIRTWVLIADGSRAKVLETVGPGSGFQDVADMTRSTDRPKSRDILKDIIWTPPARRGI